MEININLTVLYLSTYLSIIKISFSVFLFPADPDVTDSSFAANSTFDESFVSGYEKKKSNQMIMDFLCLCNSDELAMVPGCPKTKAKLIVELKPFDSWKDMVIVYSLTLMFLCCL